VLLVEEPAAMTADLATRRLDHLPIIGNALKKLRIREHVDARVPTDPRSHVTTGEAIEGLIAAIVLGKHTLYRVDELLGPYDLELAFGWGFDANHLNDTRLAKALDDLFEAGPAAVHAEVVATAVEVYDLLLRRLHYDTTSAKVYGEYRNSREPDDPEEPDAIPHLTYGHSKDHRPDLKQLVISLTAAVDRHGAVPIMGRAASGNRSDALEGDAVLRELAHRFADVSEFVLVADSKFFGGRRLLAVEHVDLSYVTLVPRSVAIQREAVNRYREDTSETQPPLLKTKEGRREEDGELEWFGRSYDMTYEWDGREDGEDRDVSIPVRLLVVESPNLREKKLRSLEKRQTAEGARIAKRVEQLAKREFRCKADAEAALARFVEYAVQFHRFETGVRYEDVPMKRDRPGRPRKDEERKTRRVWRVDVDVSEDEDAFDAAVFEAGCFVLATNLPHEGKKGHTDGEILEAYDEQQSVEGCMAWAKGPLRVAPIFLKTPKRVAALCGVYVLALMVYALIQRDIRQRLEDANTTMPGNRGQGWTARPTTEVLFRLFEGINTVRGLPTGEARVVVTGMNTEQVRILDLLDVGVLSTPGVSVVEPTVPTRGRAAKPVPRTTPRKKPRSWARKKTKASRR